MRVVVAAGAGALIEIGCPGIGLMTIAGEVADGVAELLVTRPAETDDTAFAGLSRGWGHTGQAGQGLRSAEAAATVGDFGQRRAARTVPLRGRVLKMCWSTWAASSWLIWTVRAFICCASVVSTAASARVIWACAVSSPSDDKESNYQARSARSERSERRNQTGKLCR
jgi:hypothetical protein